MGVPGSEMKAPIDLRSTRARLLILVTTDSSLLSTTLPHLPPRIIARIRSRRRADHERVCECSKVLAPRTRRRQKAQLFKKCGFWHPLTESAKA